MCETPKSPPGDYNLTHDNVRYRGYFRLSVKHLNPRQGITTPTISLILFPPFRPARVKHLNPRQGITTRSPWLLLAAAGAAACETPKSPPGDYNAAARRGVERDAAVAV